MDGTRDTADTARRLMLSDLLDAALDESTEQRVERLKALRLTDPQMAAALQSLLDAQQHAIAQRFLEEPSPILRPSLEGQRIGAYTLMRCLGEGGMGSVWLGRRSDGRFEGQAAIKLLHAGMMRASDLERFRREGSLLARLSHPNIARLIDAGVSDQHQPYLVLEYVQGQPIDVYCDAHNYTVDQRVGLFIQVLDAVAHAHARLVVHRDIKPSNVLVNPEGVVKLLDFGIAKLLDSDATVPSELTQESGRAFTPQFAAPEQLAGEAVTTATDVYALGALLYVLLTKHNPLLTGGARRAVTEPLAPASTVVTKAYPERERALRGDLDNILAKALRTDPANRFATADSFADDLRRYLRGDAVSARPDTFAYRTRCFVRRHRGAVAGVLLGLLAVVSFAAVAVWQAHEAKVQRSIAEKQTRVAVARGAAAFAVSQAPLRIDRALLLGAEAVMSHTAPETGVGLLTAMDAARYLTRFRHDVGSGINSLAVNDGRNELITLDANGLLRRLSLADGKELASRESGARAALGIALFAEERLLLVSGQQGGLIFDAETLQPVTDWAQITLQDSHQVAISDITADGTLGAVVAYLGHEILISDTRSGALVNRLTPEHCAPINNVTFAPSGRELAVACDTGAQFYDPRSGRQLRSLRTTPLATVGLSPDGRYAILASFDGEPSIVDAQTLVPVVPSLAVPGGRLYSAQFSRDGNFLAVGSDSGAVAVWDLAQRREITRFGGLEDGVLAIEWLEDEFSVAPDSGIQGHARLLVGTASSITEWDLTQSSAIGRAARDLQLSTNNSIDEVVDAPRGVAYRQSSVGVVEVVGLLSGHVLRSFKVAAADLMALTVSPDGKLLHAAVTPGSSSGRGTLAELVVVATASGSVVKRLPIPRDFVSNTPLDQKRSPFVMRFSENGERLAGVAYGHAVIWSLAEERIVAETAVHPRTRVIAWSPDDRFLATTREMAVVTILETQRLNTSRVFERSTDYTIKHMTPSHALGGILVTSESGEAYVLDPARGELLGEPFRAGGSQLQRSAVNADGTLLAAWSTDGAVRIWDVASRLAIGPPLRGHPAGRLLNRIWFNADGSLSTYTPGLRIDWNPDLAKAAQIACVRVGRKLTAQEWRQYVGDIDYQPACDPR